MRWLVGVALGLACALAQAQSKTYSLKFNHVLGPKEPYHEGFLTWAKRVDARTKGALKIEVFHSAQLGKEEDILEQIRRARTSARTPTRRAWATTCRASP